jgi:hypothetical protein
LVVPSAADTSHSTSPKAARRLGTAITGKEDDMTSSNDRLRPKIARIWRGRTPAARADEYAAYLYEVGIRPLEEKAIAVQLLREDRAGESEFVTISYWESIAAMSRFAGPDPRRIHHLPRDNEFLTELPESVQVLEITAAKGLFD